MIPMVYRTPPSASKTIPAVGIAAKTSFMMAITDQPIITYKNIDALCHFVRFMELNTIPKMVQKRFTPNSIQPLEPPIKTKDIGIYEPNIKRKIEQWSKILKTFFAHTLVREWYRVEKVYKIIKEAP